MERRSAGGDGWGAHACVQRTRGGAPALKASWRSSIARGMTEDAFPKAVSADEASLRRDFAAAFAMGGNHPLLAADDVLDRSGSTSALLACAVRSMWEVTECVTKIDADVPSGRPDGTVPELLQRAVAGQIRFAVRALEAHARGNGYDAKPWLDEVWLSAAADLARLSGPFPTVWTGWSALERGPWGWEGSMAADGIFDALASHGLERMKVPECLRHALGSWLALWVMARELAASEVL